MNKQEPFVIERTYNAPVSRVWKAISDREQMKQWYFDIPEFRAEVGAEFEFWGGPDDRAYRHLCIVKEVIPEKKLSYSWRYDGYEGDSLVTFELFPEDGQTRLRLTHSGLETFPASNPDLVKENFMAGWNDIIGDLLRKFVEVAHLNRDVVLHADPETVWNILTDLGKVRQWASAFYEGTYVETDWKEGSEVRWMAAGELGVRGIVEVNDPPRTLRVRFFDDLETTDPKLLGDYVEEYEVVSQGEGRTKLEITSGPLPLKDIETHGPMWDKAIVLMQRLAEQ